MEDGTQQQTPTDVACTIKEESRKRKLVRTQSTSDEVSVATAAAEDRPKSKKLNNVATTTADKRLVSEDEKNRTQYFRGCDRAREDCRPTASVECFQFNVNNDDANSTGCTPSQSKATPQLQVRQAVGSCKIVPYVSKCRASVRFSKKFLYYCFNVGWGC